MTTGSEVSVLRGEEAFDIPEWRDLLARDADAHVFATPEWQRLWWEEFGAGKELIVLVVRRDDRVVAIVPLYRKDEDGARVLRFVGGIDLTDYLGPICPVEERAEIAEVLINWLRDTELAWDVFDAHNMPVPFGFAEALVERADHHGLGFSLDQEETAAVLRLTGDWEAYLEGLDPKERRELKRKRRRLTRENPDARVRTSTPETLERDLEIFVDMHRGTEGLKGHFMRPEIATFFERIARRFSELGWLRLDFLEIAGKAVATTFGFRVGDTLYLYNSAYEPDAKRLSPGLFLVSTLIESAIDDGLRVFDFLRGPERYKYQLGSEAVPLNNVRIVRTGA